MSGQAFLMRCELALGAFSIRVMHPVKPTLPVVPDFVFVIPNWLPAREIHGIGQQINPKVLRSRSSCHAYRSSSLFMRHLTVV